MKEFFSKISDAIKIPTKEVENLFQEGSILVFDRYSLMCFYHETWPEYSSDKHKKLIVKDLKETYSIASVTPAVIDPEYTKLRLNIVFVYNSKNTIKAKENRMVVFDGNIQHCAYLNNKIDRRIVINFNYYEKS